MLACSSSVYGSINVSGAITSDTTWGTSDPSPDGVYIVTGDITITDGATLEIEAGVQVLFNQDMNFYVGGASGEYGCLLSQGTSGTPVIFTSAQTTPAAGDWQTLYFRDNSDDSMLTYTDISYGGGANSGMVYLEDSEASFSHCNIQYSITSGVRAVAGSSPSFSFTDFSDNGTYGIAAEGSSMLVVTDSSSQNNGDHGVYGATTGSLDISDGNFSSNGGYGIYTVDGTCLISLTDSLFTNNTGTPLRLGANRIGFTAGNIFSGNGNSFIECAGATVALDGIWHDQGIPYRILGDVSIMGQAGPDAVTTVTIQPGAEFEFDSAVGLTVGHDTDSNLPGELIADGSGGDRIFFTGIDAMGTWEGIQFLNYADDDSLMNNCVVEYSSSYGIHSNSCSPTFIGCDITDSADHGLYVTGGPAEPTVSDCLIDSNGGYGIYCNDSSCGPFITNAVISNNAADYSIYTYGGKCQNITGSTVDKDVYVIAETLSIDAVWEDPGAAFYMTNGFTVQGQSGADNVTTLTLLAGTVVKLPDQARIIIGHDSNSNYPGALITSGTDMNPVVITSTSDVPVPGSWRDVYFAQYSDDALCELNHTVIEYGGQYVSSVKYYPVSCNSASPTLTNCTIRYAFDSGIYALDSAPVINGCTVIETGEYNIHFDNSYGSITDCTLSDSANGYHAIYLTVEGETVISGNLIADSGGYGIYCNTDAISPVITDNVFFNNLNGPIYIYAKHVKNIGLPPNTFMMPITPDVPNMIYVVGDTIGTDCIWINQHIPYRIAGDIYVKGTDGADFVTTITIEPGAELVFDHQQGLWIGSNNPGEPGGIYAVGTAGQRITFTGFENSHGYWDGIYFYDFSDDSICLMEYCDVMFGGYSSNENIYCYSASPTFRHCRILRGQGYNFYSYYWSNPILEDCEIAYGTSYGIYCSSNSSINGTGLDIHDNASHGIYASGTSFAVVSDSTFTRNYYGINANDTTDYAVISNCSFIDNQGYPIRMRARHIAGIGPCTFSGNRWEYITAGSDTLTEDTYWEKRSIPYCIEGWITVQGKDGPDEVTTWTLAPGVEFYINDNVGFYIGHNSDPLYPGALVAVGTAEQRITFTSRSDSPSQDDWAGIYYYRYSDDNACLMEYCDVEFGGYSSHEQIYCIDSAPTFRYCNIQYGGGYNIRSHDHANPTFEHCNILAATSYGIYCDNYGDINMTDCIVAGNRSYGIYTNNYGDAHISNSTIRDNTSYGVYLSSNARIHLDNTTISGNYTYGFYSDSPAHVFSVNNCHFSYNNGYPVYAYARQMGYFSNCTFEGNNYEAFHVVPDTITQDSYWENHDKEPYWITGDVYVKGQDGADSVTTLYIEEGAELHFESTDGLYIGDDDTVTEPGGLMAVGTASEPILFTGRQENPSHGFWDGIIFQKYSEDSLCLMEHCKIMSGGYSNWEAVHCIDASPTLRHCLIEYAGGTGIYSYQNSNPVVEYCEIRNSSSHGIYCDTGSDMQISDSTIRHNSTYGIYINNTATIHISDSTIEENGSTGLYCNGSEDSAFVDGCTFLFNYTYPIRMYASKVRGVTDCSFLYNYTQRFYVLGDTISLDSYWEDHGIPYYVHSGDVYVRGQAGADHLTTLTLEPGCELLFNGIGMFIGHDSNNLLPGALVAEGSPSNPIVFTSHSSSPSPGHWRGIYFSNYCDDAVTSLKHCVIEYGGAGDPYENVLCYESSPVLQDCEIGFGAGNGVRAHTNSANPTLINCRVHHNTSSGVYAAPGTVQITGGQIENNSQYGIYVSEAVGGIPSTIVNAAKIRDNYGYGAFVTGANSTPVFKNCELHSNNDGSAGYGIYVESAALPVIGGSAMDYNSFSSHINYAVYNADPTTCINAQYNYWGMYGGPLDVEYGVDDCMDDGNNNIGAERVSDDVDYGNWTNDDFTPTPVPSATTTPIPTMVPTAEPTVTPTFICLNDGDVDNDGQITVTDAQLTFMIVLGYFTPTFEEECSANCNGDANVTIADAQCMFMYYLGMDCECADPLSKGLPAAPQNELNENVKTIGPISQSTDALLKALAQDDMIWIDDASGCENEIVEIAVRISNPDAQLDSFGVTLDYSTDMLEFVECRQGNPDVDWLMFGANEPNAGEIRIAGFTDPEEGIPAENNEILAVLTFKVTCDGCRIGERSDIGFSHLTDDIGDWNGLSGTFTFCELMPAETHNYLEGKTLWTPVDELQDDQLY